jgi:hypothetical protein
MTAWFNVSHGEADATIVPPAATALALATRQDKIENWSFAPKLSAANAPPLQA